MTQNALTVQPEMTPNPNSVKFVLNRNLLEGGGYSFASPEQCVQAPLAAEIFKLPGVTEIYLGRHFVTVTAGGPGLMAGLQDRIIATLLTFVSSGKAAITPGRAAAAQVGQTETERGIIEIIEREIRPAVARDGGDIVFSSFEDGIVKLHLRGACSGCPGARMTLKMGVEERLKRSFPEIQGVEAV